ncbi:hypothetical protein PRIPAC_88742 [Pristionchus pacificus]|uniref:Uncharacterized protein n=1 Tax=Pristionchus pacificus TaxID=54126 RepID=A0A2A6B757_PRIPA|nr:hypothetical protein PRIPAC_88742 [Pristionchus pacificus]|eukprot:PDM61712.1 hypothetical protein PRIPAC_51154 [Pristionchus pacificus]
MDARSILLVVALTMAVAGVPTKDPIHHPTKHILSADFGDDVEKERPGVQLRALNAMDYAKEATKEAAKSAAEQEPVMMAGRAIYMRTKRSDAENMNVIDPDKPTLAEKAKQEASPSAPAGSWSRRTAMKESEYAVRLEVSNGNLHLQTAKAIEKAKEATNEAVKSAAETVQTAYDGTRGAFAMAAESAGTTAQNAKEATSEAAAKAALETANKAADAASEQAHAAYEGMQGSFAMAAEAAEKTKTEEPASEEERVLLAGPAYSGRTKRTDSAEVKKKKTIDAINEVSKLAEEKVNDTAAADKAEEVVDGANGAGKGLVESEPVDYYADFCTQSFTFLKFSVVKSHFRATKLVNNGGPADSDRTLSQPQLSPIDCTTPMKESTMLLRIHFLLAVMTVGASMPTKDPGTSELAKAFFRLLVLSDNDYTEATKDPQTSELAKAIFRLLVLASNDSHQEGHDPTKKVIEDAFEEVKKAREAAEDARCLEAQMEYERQQAAKETTPEPNLLAGHALSGRTKRSDTQGAVAMVEEAMEHHEHHDSPTKAADKPVKTSSVKKVAPSTESAHLHHPYEGLQGSFAMAEEGMEHTDTRNPLEPSKELISDLAKYESDEENFICEGNSNAFTESESSKDLAYEYLDIEMARKTMSERDTRNPLEPSKELISDLAKYESDEENFIYEGNSNAFHNSVFACEDAEKAKKEFDEKWHTAFHHENPHHVDRSPEEKEEKPVDPHADDPYYCGSLEGRNPIEKRKLQESMAEEVAKEEEAEDNFCYEGNTNCFERADLAY